MWNESTVIVGVAAVVGAAVAAWGVRGDRARGRKRCGRCWYDLSGGGTTCSECGWVARDERAMLRTKRRWWAVMLGVVVLALGVGAGRMRSANGWAGMLPTRVVIWALPPADAEEIALDNVTTIVPKDWASIEMQRRLERELLDGEEVLAALRKQGAFRTLKRWPVGSTVYVSLKPVSWIVGYMVIGEMGQFTVEEASGRGSVIADDSIGKARTTSIPAANAGDGRGSSELEVFVVAAAPMLSFKLPVEYEGVPSVEPAADASAEASSVVAGAIEVELSGGGNISEMIKLKLRRTREIESMGVEVVVEVDTGDGWTQAEIVSSGGRISPRVGNDETLTTEAGEPLVRECLLWPLPSGAAEQNAWKVRLRGVRPTTQEAWPAERYWSGEVVFTIGELRKRAGR